ncbi:Hsp70 family protein [Glycomyces sp. TRM65418]|uniref:Hsp70 family protein n=1 Tax=Glycomyces sp. TRM65418 TaxID=2867006 RepID=UPI001CE647F7|nr:Hsp70 family protein [Glycomyces sp. TRM65418]QZD55494.1 Hsp70 family protein [Glycomyces sp. TRM65418]
MIRSLPHGTSLGIDFGTSNTVAVVGRPDGSVRPLLVGGSPLLPSAVCADGAGGLVVGRDAVHAGRRFPERFEPNPKRHIDRSSVLLGAQEFRIADVVGAVLRAVADECRRVVGEPRQVTVTVPAAWGPSRRQVIEDAATAGGLGRVRLVPEPVAAATYFAEVLEHHIAIGSSIVVYDLGAGTFDASVVRRTAHGFATAALEGRADLGGLDIDAAVFSHLAETYGAHANWGRLADPVTAQDRRGRRAFLDEIRAAKERLSRHQQADFTIPLLDVDAHLTRAELERIAAPHLEQTIRVTQAVVRAAGIDVAQSAGVFLVGGASRMPLVATMLHRELGIAPTVMEQPEAVVAEGSVLCAEPANTSFPVPSPLATPPWADRSAPSETTPPASVPSGPPRFGDAEATGPSRKHRQRHARKLALAGILAGVLIAATLVFVFEPDGDEGEAGAGTGADAVAGPGDGDGAGSESAGAAAGPPAGEPLGEPLAAHEGPVAAVASIEADGRVVLFTSGSEDGKVKQWDLAGKPLGEADFDVPIVMMEPLAFPDGSTRIAAVDEAGGVHVWLPTDFAPELVRAGEGIEESILSLGLLEHHGTPVLAAASHTGLALYDLHDQVPLSLVNYEGDPDLGFDHAQVLQLEDAAAVVAADSDGTLRLYDPTTGDRLGDPFGPEEPGPEGSGWADGAEVDGLRVVYDDGVPYGLLYDGEQLHLWNLAAREQPSAETIPLPDMEDPFLVQAVESEGRLALLMAGGRAGAEAREFSTGNGLLPDAGWTQVSASAVGVAQTGEQTIAITGSADGTVHLWSLGD